MDKIIDEILKGLINFLEWNDEIEENLKKVVKVKIDQFVTILKQKGFSVDRFSLEDKILDRAEKIFADILFEKMRPHIRKFLQFSIWEAYNLTGIISDNYIAYFESYLKNNLTNSKIRKAFYQISILLNSDLIERYAQHYHARKGYGSLYIFAKPINTPKLLSEFLRLAAFFVPLALDGFTLEAQTYFLEQNLGSKELFEEYCKKLTRYVREHFDKIPLPVFQTGVESHINREQIVADIGVNIRADLLKILLLMAKFKQNPAAGAAKNKKADSPEKSLFSLFQKQTKFLGIEKNLTYEMELIAKENKW